MDVQSIQELHQSSDESKAVSLLRLGEENGSLISCHSSLVLIHEA